MLKKIANIFKKGGDVAKATPKVITKTISEEIEEIKDLNLTEVDKVQGELIATVAVQAMNSLGIPYSMAMKEVIKTSAAYCLRDLKEGSTNPNKLIIMRVVNNYREKLALKKQQK